MTHSSPFDIIAIARLGSPTMGCSSSAPESGDAVAPFETLPKWEKLVKMGLSPADIAAEAAHFKSYAGPRNLYEWPEEQWFEVAKYTEKTVPIPKEALAKAGAQLPMCFPYAFGADEEKALLNLVKSCGMDNEVAAIDATNAIITALALPVLDESKMGDVIPYATKAGKKLGIPIELNIPHIPGGSPEYEEEEEED